MALNLGCSPCLFHHFHTNFANTTIATSSSISPIFHHLCLSSISRSNTDLRSKTSASANSDSSLLEDDKLLIQISMTANDADQALQMITEMSERDGGTVSASDCCSIITAALQRNNVQLALSLYSAMRSTSTFEHGLFADKWKWARPDVRVYASLIQGLASSLRVSNAIVIINDVCRVGVSSTEEVPFGKVVRCPSCMIAVAVAQPQHGVQIASCYKCRYQYELVSGCILSMESEEISMDIPAWERGLRFLKLMKQSLPAAVHSIVVQTPTGVARTYRFATKSVELPAQQGERVTISVAAPSNVYREVGPFRFISKAPGFNFGEPMFLTNHTDGRQSQLLRAPAKNASLSLRNPSILIPLLTLLATGDAASKIIDPSLPQLVSVSVVASVALGTTLNTLVLPELNKVWMLARMCQLENKILAVGEPSYRARRSRIKRVRESLESSIVRRIELIDSYARISSMIEIEVEMDSDVLAAEATSNVESISEQIEQIMELENLEERFHYQIDSDC